MNITYYDSYHKDPFYWKTLTIQLNVLSSEPPKFSTNIDNITVNMCSDNEYLLPSAFDPKNYTFSISLVDNSLEWVRIVSTNVTTILSINTTFLGLLTVDAQYSIGIKLENSVASFSIYNISIVILKQDIPYFENIPNLTIPFSKRYDLYFKIVSSFNIFNLELDVNAIYWKSADDVWWIKQNLNQYTIFDVV